MDGYFYEYRNKFYNMQDKLVELKTAKENFYNLTGIELTDSIKSHKIIGYIDQLAEIEEIEIEYKKLKKEYEEERIKCLNDINKINYLVYRTIIKLAYLEFKSNKEISSILSRQYKKEYTVSSIRNLKTRANLVFEKILKSETFCDKK